MGFNVSRASKTSNFQPLSFESLKNILFSRMLLSNDLSGLTCLGGKYIWFRKMLLFNNVPNLIVSEEKYIWFRRMLLSNDLPGLSPEDEEEYRKMISTPGTLLRFNYSIFLSYFSLLVHKDTEFKSQTQIF